MISSPAHHPCTCTNSCLIYLSFYYHLRIQSIGTGTQTHTISLPWMRLIRNEKTHILQTCKLLDSVRWLANILTSTYKTSLAERIRIGLNPWLDRGYAKMWHRITVWQYDNIPIWPLNSSSRSLLRVPIQAEQMREWSPGEGRLGGGASALELPPSQN